MFYKFLQNVIYTIQSKSFIWNKFFICFFKKAFYGLRQFFRIWYDLIRDFLQTLEFKHNKFNHFFFIHFLWRIYICIYVNNFFIFFSDIDHIDAIKQTLFNHFRMINLNSVSHYLKLSIIKIDNESIIFNQKHYFEKIFKRFEIKNCTFVLIFINFDVFKFIFSNFFLYSTFKKNFYWYDSIIKSINFAVIMTRFNIFYAVFIISCYCSNSRQKHVKLIIELFYYIKKIIDYDIIYQTNGLFFLNYVDFDFVEIVNNRRFTIKWVFLFVDDFIFWSFKK